jgi:signal transduction histidine kinase/NAD-dependent dihydropyrimidine dehydrogenase PreA subunit
MTSSIFATAREKCRRCYSCVRRCPAKAIRVQGGQAEVVEERCVACGRCTTVCSQNARSVVDNLPAVDRLLALDNTVVMLAPSFAAAFPDLRPGQVVSALRVAGFRAVHEVAFGADLVSRVHRRYHDAHPDRLTITTPCPAAVSYVRKYAPDLVPFLAPVLSPMAAMGKVLKTRLRPGCRVVFAGPCTAKISEAMDPEVSPWVDAVLTFVEVERLLARLEIPPGQLPDAEMDGPQACLGGIFPVAGGLVRSAGLPADILENRIVEISGPDRFIDVTRRLLTRVREDRVEDLETRLFDVLFCKGCIEGPAMTGQDSPLTRKERVVDFVRSRRASLDAVRWEASMAALADVDLGRTFTRDDQAVSDPSEEQIQVILRRTGKNSPADELNCRACGYRSCREKAVAVFHGLAEEEMCLPHLIDRLQQTVNKLNQSHEQLTEAQAQILRSERLASMGQLAAGVAHEVNNPLGTILIYAHLLSDAVRDRSAGPEALLEDVQMILAEATRCKGIVGGLLDFARQNKVKRAMVDLREVVNESIRIVAAQVADDRYTFDVTFTEEMPPAFVDRDQLLQVMLNVVKNAVEIMPDGGPVRVTLAWQPASRDYRIAVRDAGLGISPDAMTKIFTPFFTTKPQGRGTGLGLPICYGIVKMHRGSITARNNPDGPGATFVITLPAVSKDDPHGTHAHSPG